MAKKKKEEYAIGDVIEGTITGIQSYGIFVQLDQHHQGLVHISEVANGYVSDIHKDYAVGDKVKVIIIDIDEYTGKISLSIRALLPNQVDYKPYRGPRKHSHKEPKIGFKSLADKMPEWMDTALKDINSGKIKSYKEDNNGTYQF